MPPLPGLAVNVTEVPGQIEPDTLSVIEIDTDTMGFTVMVSVLEVAGEPEEHAAFDVNTQVILSLLLSELVV